MSDRQAPTQHGDGEALPTVARIAQLDAFLESLVAERRPVAHRLTAREMREHMLAAQLRLARDGVEDPTPEFLRTLEQTVAQQRARQERTRSWAGVNRGRFLGAALRTAAAGLVGAGITLQAEQSQMHAPHALVADGGRWYDVAAADELSAGQMKPFTAGGVLGYLVNEGGRLHAVSSICTHMGCRLKPAYGNTGLHCLCHGSQFSTDGTAISGVAPGPLPRIDVRIEGGRVYARGTVEDV